jgi:hypothetical protein
MMKRAQETERASLRQPGGHPVLIETQMTQERRMEQISQCGLCLYRDRQLNNGKVMVSTVVSKRCELGDDEMKNPHFRCTTMPESIHSGCLTLATTGFAVHSGVVIVTSL